MMAIFKIALLLVVGLLSCSGFPQREPGAGGHGQHHHSSGQYVDQSEFPNGHVQGGVDVKPRLPGNGFAYLMGGYGLELKDLAGEDESGEGNTHDGVGSNDISNQNKHAPNTQVSPGFGPNNGLNGQGQQGSPNQGNVFRPGPNNGTGSVNQGPQTGFGGNNQGPQNGPGYNQGPVSGVGPSYQGPQHGLRNTQDPYNQGGHNNGPYNGQNGFNNYPHGPEGYNQGQGGYNNGPYNSQGGYNQGAYGNIPQNGPGGYNHGPRGYTPYNNQGSNGFNQLPGSNAFNGQADVNLGGYRGTLGFGQGYGQNPYNGNGYYQNPNEGNQGPNRRRNGYSQHQQGYDQNPTEFGEYPQGHRRPTNFAKGGRTFTKSGSQTGPIQNNHSQNFEQLNQGNSYIETTTSISSKLHDVELLPAGSP